MSVLWKKIEFYKGEGDHEAMIIEAGVLDGTVSHPVSSVSGMVGQGMGRPPSPIS